MSGVPQVPKTSLAHANFLSKIGTPRTCGALPREGHGFGGGEGTWLHSQTPPAGHKHLSTRLGIPSQEHRKSIPRAWWMPPVMLHTHSENTQGWLAMAENSRPNSHCEVKFSPLSQPVPLSVTLSWPHWSPSVIPEWPQRTPCSPQGYLHIPATARCQAPGTLPPIAHVSPYSGSPGLGLQDHTEVPGLPLLPPWCGHGSP